MTEKPSEAYLAGYFFGREGRRTERRFDEWVLKSKPTPKASSTVAAPLAPLRNGARRSSTSLASGSTGTIGSTSKVRRSRTVARRSTLIEPAHAPVSSRVNVKRTAGVDRWK